MLKVTLANYNSKKQKTSKTICSLFIFDKEEYKVIIMNLRNYINRNFIVSEHLHPIDMMGYMDAVIDDINEDMQTTFPTFSEWADFCAEHPELELDPSVYTAFPSMYLRRVVAPGTALKFYAYDEEGEQVASKFYLDYEKGRFGMLRDYLHKVPEHFQNKEGGFVGFFYDISPRGVDIYHGDSQL